MVHATADLSYQRDLTSRRWIAHPDVSSMPESDPDVWDQLHRLHVVVGTRTRPAPLEPDPTGRRYDHGRARLQPRDAHQRPAPGSATSIPGQRPMTPDRSVRSGSRSSLAALRARLDAARPTNIGFPSTLDLDITPLLPFLNHLLNNVGDPDQASVFPAHTKDLEREVVDIIASILRAPVDDRWGYVTSGGSEGVEYGLLLARTLYPDAVVYASSGVALVRFRRSGSRLRMPAITVRALPDGRMDLRDLRVALRQHRQSPAIVVANIGTTMTEAVDDVVRDPPSAGRHPDQPGVRPRRRRTVRAAPGSAAA